MGYSIYTPVRSKELEKEMLAFLKKEFKHYDEIRKDGHKADMQGISDPGNCEEIYFGRKTLVGFQYKSWWSMMEPLGFERSYYNIVLKWIALQVGKRRIRFNSEEFGTVTEPTPYTVYDGCDNEPVFLKKPRKKSVLWRWTDKYGICKDATCLYEAHSALLLSKHAATKSGYKKVIRDFLKKQGWTKEDMFAVPGRPGLIVEACLADVHESYMQPIRDEMKRLDEAWQKR